LHKIAQKTLKIAKNRGGDFPEGQLWWQDNFEMDSNWTNL